MLDRVPVLGAPSLRTTGGISNKGGGPSYLTSGMSCAQQRGVDRVPEELFYDLESENGPNTSMEANGRHAEPSL
jgi:hypothetical protein